MSGEPTLRRGAAMSEAHVMRVVAPLLLGLAATTLLVLTQRIRVVDDAYISYRYVLNLLDHGQLVFNLGERVEGATNLLWMLCIAAGRAATQSSAEIVSLGLALLLFALMAARLIALGIGVSRRPALGWFANAAVLLNADVFLTATNGLEAALYMALMTEAFAALLAGQGTRLGAVLGLLFATRPEGGIIGLVLISGHVWQERSWGAIRRVLGAWFALLGAVTMFRLAYFHALIPNSIVAKSFPLAMLPDVLVERSWPYVRNFWIADPVLALVLLGMAAGCLWATTRHPGFHHSTGQVAQPRLILACCTAVALISYGVAARNGGDWIDHFRLLTQYAPAYALGLSALGALGFVNTPLVCLLAGVSLLLLPLRPCCSIDVVIVPPGDFFAEATRRLSGVLRPDDVVAAEAAGLLPYRLIDTRIHDPTGLMDPVIARQGTPAIPYGKIDIPYTFGTVRPSFMVWHWAGHIASAPEPMRAEYRGFCFRFCDDRRSAMVVLVRQDRMKEAVARAFADWLPWRLQD